jgi:hypothetical protein
MSKELSEDELRQHLARECRKAGSPSRWAEANGVSRSYLSEVLSGRQAPGESICRALGYRRAITYVPDAWDEPTPDAWQKGSK